MACEVQLVSSRIWTRLAVSISYDDNHHTMGTSNTTGTSTLYLINCEINSLKPKHYWSLTIRPRTLVWESYTSSKKKSVYSTAPANWETTTLGQYGPRYNINDGVLHNSKVSAIGAFLSKSSWPHQKKKKKTIDECMNIFVVVAHKRIL